MAVAENGESIRLKGIIPALASSKTLSGLDHKFVPGFLDLLLLPWREKAGMRGDLIAKHPLTLSLSLRGRGDLINRNEFMNRYT
jgi:hypothetical protein